MKWLTGVLVGATLFTARILQAADAPAPRPNIIFILIDDQRWDTLGCMGHPFAQTPNIDRIGHEGAIFRNAFVTTSLCSPSRASLLTGTYAHTHGVVGNEVKIYDPDWSKTPSFAQLLQHNGYDTAFIGKWHMAPNDRPRPGFDYWLSFKGQGVYNDPQLNENGRSFKAQGYITDLLNDYAINYLNQPHDKPFCLYLSHKAVHDPRTVPPRHENLYPDATLPKPENFDDTMAGKPRWVRELALTTYEKGKSVLPTTVPDALPPKKWDAHNKNRIDYIRLLSSIDEGVGKILDTLQKQGKLDDTVIIYAGDNGYFLGEHRLGDKRLMYEESLRIPFLMRYPRLARAGSNVEQMVLNIDLAPTLLDLAGVAIPATIQGRSLRPLLEGKSEGWRTSWLYEYWIDLKPEIPQMIGVRTDQWKLIRYPKIHETDELYDLKNDPHELHNLANDPAHAGQMKQLDAELEKLKRDTAYRDEVPAPTSNSR